MFGTVDQQCRPPYRPTQLLSREAYSANRTRQNKWTIHGAESEAKGHSKKTGENLYFWSVIFLLTVSPTIAVFACTPYFFWNKSFSPFCLVDYLQQAGSPLLQESLFLTSVCVCVEGGGSVFSGKLRVITSESSVSSSAEAAGLGWRCLGLARGEEHPQEQDPKDAVGTEKGGEKPGSGAPSPLPAPRPNPGLVARKSCN